MENFEDKKVTQYLVPANVTTQFEFFEGFGWAEFKIVLMTCAIGFIFFFLLGIPQKTVLNKQVPYVSTIIRLLFIFIPGTFSFFIVKRDPSSGMSFMQTIKSQRKYIKSQKRYLDRYGSGTEV